MSAAWQAFTLLRFVDHGSVVQVIGRTEPGGTPLVIGCDRRPFAAFHADWEAAGRPVRLYWQAAEQALALAAPEVLLDGRVG